MNKIRDGNQLPKDIDVDEILKDIDSKIQEIESRKEANEMIKTRIDGVDVKEIIKKLENETKN